ncbi:MAG: DUF805 domain-containing protein [Sulfitobacter sp.]
MITDWYYAVEGASVGPVSEEEFKKLIAAGTIHSDTLVWQEGMEDWVPFGRADGQNTAPSVPPFNAANAPPDPARADANSFQGALKDGFARYVDFRTRSTRSQFWWWSLWSILFGIAASIVDAIIGFGDSGPVNGLVSLAILLPSIAVAIRRLHDIGRSGWWYLFVFLPIIGWILLIVFFCTKTDENTNQWGNPPQR